MKPPSNPARRRNIGRHRNGRDVRARLRFPLDRPYFLSPSAGSLSTWLYLAPELSRALPASPGLSRPLARSPGLSRALSSSRALSPELSREEPPESVEFE